MYHCAPPKDFSFSCLAPMCQLHDVLVGSTTTVSACGSIHNEIISYLARQRCSVNGRNYSSAVPHIYIHIVEHAAFYEFEGVEPVKA